MVRTGAGPFKPARWNPISACKRDDNKRFSRWSEWLRRCGPFTNQLPRPSGLIAGDLHFEWHVGENRISHNDRSNSVRFQKTFYSPGFEFRRAAPFGMENRFQAHSSEVRADFTFGSSRRLNIQQAKYQLASLLRIYRSTGSFHGSKAMG